MTAITITVRGLATGSLLGSLSLLDLALSLCHCYTSDEMVMIPRERLRLATFLLLLSTVVLLSTRAPTVPLWIYFHISLLLSSRVISVIRSFEAREMLGDRTHTVTTTLF